MAMCFNVFDGFMAIATTSQCTKHHTTFVVAIFARVLQEVVSFAPSSCLPRRRQRRRLPCQSQPVFCKRWLDTSEMHLQRQRGNHSTQPQPENPLLGLASLLVPLVASLPVPLVARSCPPRSLQMCQRPLCKLCERLLRPHHSLCRSKPRLHHPRHQRRVMHHHRQSLHCHNKFHNHHQQPPHELKLQVHH